MIMNQKKFLSFWLPAMVAVVALIGAACSSGDVSQDDYDSALAERDAAQQQVTQLQAQLASMGPVNVVQAGQLAPPPAGTEPTGWDTAESLRGGLELVATYDSSGPDAWDVGAHPNVYMSSQGMGYGHRRSEDNVYPGVYVIDSYTKEVIASALYDLGGEPNRQPHGLGVSQDGKWVYVGFRQRNADGQQNPWTLIINARTLKLHMVVQHTGGQNLHHIMSFTDWMGRDRVVLEYGFGSNGGPHFILDPNDNHRVVKAINEVDTGYHMGHPFLTVDPTGKYLYVNLKVVPWEHYTPEIGGLAKINMENWSTTVIAGTGNHPIGVAHTADGKYTYVIDGHASLVFKIDNETNEVIDSTSAGVAGPYGIALNWDESEIWTVGKGEGSHNTGGVLGVIATNGFRAVRDFDQPVNIGGSIIDHALLHPDPAVNELWVSSAGTFDTIVVDLNTREVVARIPTPSGGDTHSGAFVRYASDWTGELLVDHGGPKAAMQQMKLNNYINPPETPATPVPPIGSQQ